MIRFTCSCGQQLSAEDASAGQEVTCRSCDEPVTVPDESTLPEDDPSYDPEVIEDMDPDERVWPGEDISPPNAELNPYHEAILHDWDGPVLDVSVTEYDELSYTLRLGRTRSQEINITTVETENGVTLLLLTSQVGTVSTADEHETALMQNAGLFFGRLQKEADGSLLVVHALFLEQTDPVDEFLPVFEYIAVQADRIEREMFGVDEH